MPTIDTSWLLALLDADDAHHKKAQAEAKKLHVGTVPHVVLAETLQVIGFKVRRAHNEKKAQAAIRQNLKALQSQPFFRFEEELDLGDTYEILAAHAKLSFVDAACVAVARTQDGHLLSFDANQKAALKGN